LRGPVCVSGWLACLLFAAPAAAGPPPPQPPTAPSVPRGPVPLGEAVRIAIENHGRIAVAEENILTAKERVRQARTGTLPSVRGSVGYNTRGTSSLGRIFGSEPTTVGQGPNGPIRTTVETDSSTSDRGLQPRVEIGYNIYDGGLTRASVRQAKANVDGTVAGLGSVRNNLALEVTTNYLLQLRARRLLDLRLEQERLAAEQVRSVEARIAAGEAAEADRALPLSELRNRQVDRIFAQNDVLLAANALRNSMGLAAGPPLDLVEIPEAQEALPPVESLIETAKRQRPEVVQAETRVRAAEASVTIAKIGRKPRLDATFSFNLTPNNAFQRSDYAVGAAISMPLWDAGLTESREKEARSGVSSAQADLDQIRKDVTADVVDAHLNLVNARERLAAGRLAVEAAQVNLEQTTARYNRGLRGTTVVELIQAQVQFATASNGVINALYDIHVARAQLDRAIGR
jgi:outer membrane protein